MQKAIKRQREILKSVKKEEKRSFHGGTYCGPTTTAIQVYEEVIASASVSVPRPRVSPTRVSLASTRRLILNGLRLTVLSSPTSHASNSFLKGFQRLFSNIRVFPSRALSLSSLFFSPFSLSLSFSSVLIFTKFQEKRFHTKKII